MSAPDEFVPLWVNIIVPIVMLALFVATIVTTYFCKYEVPIEKLPRLSCTVCDDFTFKTDIKYDDSIYNTSRYSIPCLEKVTISKEEPKEEKLKLEKTTQLCSKCTTQAPTGPALQVVYSLPESGRIIGQPNFGYQDDEVNSKTISRNINGLSSNGTNNSCLKVLTN